MLRTATHAAVALSGVLMFMAAGASATIVDYAFDADPGWLEVNNRTGDGQGQDFGFSATTYAGGTAGEIGLQLRQMSPFAHTLVVGYANAMLGYLCTEQWQKQAGSQEKFINLRLQSLSVDTEKTIIETASDLCDRIMRPVGISRSSGQHGEAL